MWLLTFLFLCPSVLAFTSCDVSDFGAVGDGHTLNTAVLTRVLRNASCDEVVVPASGVFLTGPLNVTRSNMAFRVEGTLFASNNASLYPLLPEVPSYPRSRDLGGALRHNPIVLLFNVSNVTVHGTGVIDGNGGLWWKHFHDKTQLWGRPRLFQTMYCRDVRLLNLTLKDSPFWTTHIWSSDSVEVGWLTVHSPRDQVNTDGLDPDSSSNVWGHDLNIHQGDDCIAVKSGMNEAGRTYGKPCENILIERLKCTGNSVTIGSEVSGGIRNITFRDVVMLPGASYGCELKTGPQRGAYVEDVLFENFKFDIVTSDGLSIRTSYGGDGPTNTTLPPPTRISNIRYSNIHGESLLRAGKLDCFSTFPCFNISLDNVRIASLLGYKCGDGLQNSSSVDSKPQLCHGI